MTSQFWLACAAYTLAATQMPSTAFAQLAPPPGGLGGDERPAGLAAPTPPTAADKVVAPPSADLLAQRLADLSARRKHLQEREARLAESREPASATQMATADTARADLEEAQKKLELAKWIESAHFYFKDKIQKRGFVQFAVPKSHLALAPEVAFMTRSSLGYLEPSTEARRLGQLAQKEVVLRVANLPELGWELIWTESLDSYAFVPSGAIQIVGN